MRGGHQRARWLPRVHRTELAGPGRKTLGLLLPEDRVGVLEVRSRRLDVATMVTVCAAVVYIAWTIDPLGTS